ncbi:MAG: nitroreductase family protein [Gammaproteobacteria bacterium]|nr:nitroreductase family protein [Gammaproteobacteria bacterium]
MSAQSLYELMSTQRAIRRLKPDAIPDAVLERIMQAAAWAPSGGNQQPWRMVMVSDPERKARLGELYARRWARFAELYQQRIADAEEAVRRKEERTIAAGDYLAGHFAECPVVAVACFNPDRMAITDARLDRVSVVGGGSVYPAVQNLLLACRAEGVGAVLTTLLCQDEETVKQLLDIPADWYTAAAVPMGYPVGGGYGPIDRRDVPQLFFADRWGEPVSGGSDDGGA